MQCRGRFLSHTQARSRLEKAAAMATAKVLGALTALLSCLWCGRHFTPDFRLIPTLFATSSDAADDASKVLYVLECEGPQEWQAVPAHEAVVRWVGDLKDRLTVHAGRPEGEDLAVKAAISQQALFVLAASTTHRDSEYKCNTRHCSQLIEVCCKACSHMGH